MLTKAEVLLELENRGYNIKLEKYNKNGISLDGISLKDRQISPVIYIDQIIETANENRMGLELVVSYIEDIFNKTEVPNVDLSKLKDKNFVKKNLYIGLQRKSDANIIKKDCFLDGVEEYLYIAFGGPMYIKLTKELLKEINLFEDIAWIIAEENTNNETTLNSMSELIQLPSSDMMMPDYYVLSNRKKVYGAASILNKKLLHEFAEEQNINKVIVLPSSIHEVILVPLWNDDADLDIMSEMVRDINHDNVDPSEQLMDKAYILDI